MAWADSEFYQLGSVVAAQHIHNWPLDLGDLYIYMKKIKCDVLPSGGLFASGPELIPLFPYLRAGLLKRGGGGYIGTAPGNRPLATDHDLTGFPDFQINPGLGL